MDSFDQLFAAVEAARDAAEQIGDEALIAATEIALIEAHRAGIRASQHELCQAYGAHLDRMIREGRAK
jgi:hypothetical protein